MRMNTITASIKDPATGETCTVEWKDTPRYLISSTIEAAERIEATFGFRPDINQINMRVM